MSAFMYNLARIVLSRINAGKCSQCFATSKTVDVSNLSNKLRTKALTDTIHRQHSIIFRKCRGKVIHPPAKLLDML